MQVFGKHYFMQVSDEEVDSLWHKTCIHVPQVKTKAELQDFIAE